LDDFCGEFFMPIYAYRCEACGFSKDVLQKVSDPVLTECLSCGKSTFKKQLTAAGFQLKGTGWYVTDFRGGSTPAAAAGAPDGATASASNVDQGGTPAATAVPAATPAPAPVASAPSVPKESKS
jgi:putative FmdB family regulatory protein